MLSSHVPLARGETYINLFGFPASDLDDILSKQGSSLLDLPHSGRLSCEGRPFVQGELSNPGVVPRAIQHVFDIIEKTPGRDFLLRMSMMEIYNEVRLPAPEHAAHLGSG